MTDKIKSQPSEAVSDRRGEKPFLVDRKTIAKKIAALSGGEILDLILGHKTPKDIVQDMSSGDFFWLVKKVGSDDCLPFLSWHQRINGRISWIWRFGKKTDWTWSTPLSG